MQKRKIIEGERRKPPFPPYQGGGKGNFKVPLTRGIKGGFEQDCTQRVGDISEQSHLSVEVGRKIRDDIDDCNVGNRHACSLQKDEGDIRV